jgi:hypothetical protein
MEAGTRIAAGSLASHAKCDLARQPRNLSSLLSCHLIWIAQLLAFRIEDLWVAGFRRYRLRKNASSCSAVYVSGAAVASNERRWVQAFRLTTVPSHDIHE